MSSPTIDFSIDFKRAKALRTIPAQHIYGKRHSYFGDVIEPIIVPWWDVGSLDWWAHTHLVISALARAVAQQDVVICGLVGARLVGHEV